MTPLTGFLAARFGRKRLFMAAVSGFTVASMLCGTATTLTEMVLFRLMQGAFGAALVPLSQAVLLDTFPRERHGRSEEHTSELQSLMRISYAVFCLKKKNTYNHT